MTLGDMRQDMQNFRKNGESWGDIAGRYGISKAMAWRIVNDGYEPGRATLRRLGIRKTKPRNRIAVNLDDPASAAATLRAHASPEFVAALVRELTK